MGTTGRLAESGLDEQELVALALNHSGCALYVADAKATIQYINETFTKLLGYSLEDVKGRRAREILGSSHYTDADYERLWAAFNKGRAVHEEIRTYTRDGRELWLSVILNPILAADGSVSHLVGVLEDSTESRQIQSLQRDVLEAVAMDRPLRDIGTLICERVEAMFPEVICSILSVDQDRRLRPLAAPSLPDHYNAAIDGILAGPSAGSCGTCAWRGEAVTVEDIETDPLWAEYKAVALPIGLRACWSSPIKAGDGRVVGTFAFYFREPRGPNMWHEQVVRACVQLCMLAFERNEASKAIARLAYFDPLTGLPNRAKLHQEMAARLQPGAQELALLFLDIDHFKDVNDTLGHTIGDSFLAEIADRLRAAVWPGDLICRHGGDEFVLVLYGADQKRAELAARKVLRSIAKPVQIEGVSLPASASIGISLFPSDASDGPILLRNADTAMYHAKSEGRNTYRFYSSEMNRDAQDRLLIGTLLRQAISGGQLTLSYQPQIDGPSGALIGVEALARWSHPALGVVPPSRFIPLAEEFGVIGEIGRFALGEALAQLRSWDEAGFRIPHVAVNISPLQFRDPGFPELVASVLESARLLPSRLVIEITEGVMMDASATALSNAQALRMLGVGISMDDFGTGYSSLSHLARLPVSELKIDRGFMSGLEESEAVRALVTAVIRIGESLGVKVIAEGVETPAQQTILHTLGCDALQGYLFAAALPPAEFLPWMAGRSGTRMRGAA